MLKENIQIYNKNFEVEIFLFLQNYAPMPYNGQFACPICMDIKPSKKNMVVHIRSHTGEKPFVCPHCPYACSHRSNLTRHINHRHT